MADFYPFRDIEPKWQQFWRDGGFFEMDPADPRPKFYCLMMFPYPSGELHVGHGRNYIIGDVLARYKMMQGFQVLAPMGFDAFGLPAENAAIKSGIPPAESTNRNIQRMKEQLATWGTEYDWKREVRSCDPDYYKWTQWLFLKFYERGLAYRKQAAVNWCPSCQTVLANEQVVDGACERCDSSVTTRDLEQWFFKITDYADELLDMSGLQRWPERVRTMQTNWIGRSEGALVTFTIDGTGDPLPIFTTRHDTLWGVTYMVVAPEHPIIEKVIAGTEYEQPVREFVARVRKIDRIERTSEGAPKEGVFTGAYVINPVNGDRVPLWVANYALMDYGTGAVMAVPTSDQRDFEFAKKYGLPMRIVVQPKEGEQYDEATMTEAYVDPGVVVNSDQFTGMDNEKAKGAIAAWLQEEGIGEATVTFRLRDWLVSRQRYWGAPIPIIYCEGCGAVPVAEDQLPVLLPENVEFKPTGESPLTACREFVDVACPSCGKPARRETDTMDTFVDSSWYFLRYLSPKDDDRIFDSDLVNTWLPVDQYIGGIEHAILHLMYARFFTKVIRDMGLIDFDEPFNALFTQGMIVNNGAKMSKSRGNVVSPDELVKRFGADTLRLYELFIGPPEKDAEWSDAAVDGQSRFLNRFWRLIQANASHLGSLDAGSDLDALGDADKAVRRTVHACIKKVTLDIEERFHFNTAIAAIMEAVNTLQSISLDSVQPTVLRECFESLVLLLSPLAPHICEELWRALGHEQSVLQQSWPEYDEAAIATETLKLAVQINGKVRSQIEVAADASKDVIETAALADDKVQRYINGAQVRRVVVVPGKLVNVVL